MSGRNNKKFKLAVCLLAIFGVSIFGLQQAKAVNVNNQSGLENINNYTRGEDVNITRDINLTNANLPDITGAINAVVNGNNNTISGSIFNSDADQTLTFGHYTLQDNSSLTFNNVIFSTDTTIRGTQDGQSRAWTVAGLIAQNMASTSTVNINFSDFINNNVYLYQDRSGRNMDLQNYINGGLLNNAGKMNITSSDFNNNTIRVATYKDETSWFNDGYAHAEMYGGIITNYETGVLTINGNGTASMSNNNISAYSESSTDRDPVHAIVQGGVINNEGMALIDGVQINDNTVSASTNNYGDNATAQGGAIYNAQGGSLTIQGNTSFGGNSVSASGATSNTAQGGAIYNAGAINVSGGNVTFSNNSANNAANDIYFADGSTMNLKGNSTVELGSGVQSANQTATISVEGGSNLIQANTSSSGYTGVINIASNGLLTYRSDTVNSALIKSFSNADINLSEDSGLGFDSDNNFTLDVDDIISSHDTLTPNGTLNIYKFGDGEMTLEGDFDTVSDEYFVEGGKLIASNSNISNQDTITVNNSSEFEYRAGIGEVINHNVILNNSTYTIEANNRNVTVNSAPSITGNNNTINLNTGTYTLNTDFSSTEGTADVNVSNSTLQFGTAGGINQNTTITNSTLKLANDTISTTEFANLISNGTNNLNIDIDLTNNTSDIINAGASSSGQITLNDINFIGEAYQTEYSFNVIQGNGSLAFNNYSDTIESSVYKYTVGASGQTITLNATGISDNGLKYYNHTLTDDRTFTFVGDEVYTIAEDLESTNAGDFIVQGKENTNAQANVISGGDLYSFFEVNSDKLTVNNVTIQNANANNLDELLEGSSSNTSGGVLNISGGSAEFNNVVLKSNTAYNSGGAIYSSGGTTTINNSIISDNSSGTGGAIAAGGGEIIINGSSITGNSAAYGGAINSAGDNAEITVNDSVISNNSATGDGSAIYNAMGSTVNLNDAAITGNTGNSSIYNTGSNSTINIENDNNNTVNNNAVIKNTGKINITANNGSTTTIQDAIQNLDTTDDTLGNIETTGKVIFSDITKQNIEQNDSQVTVANLSDSTYTQKEGFLAAATVSNSTITTLQNQANLNVLDLNTVKEGSIINANDGMTIIGVLDASRVNAGADTESTEIATVRNNSTVNLSGGENTITTINSSTVETSGNTTETTITTALNNSSIINQSGTVNITTLGSSDENTSPSTFTQNSGNSTIQNAINSMVDINGGESALITGSNLTISVDNGELNIGASNPSEGHDYLSNSDLTIGNGASVNLTGGNISGGTINLAASTAQEGDETNEGVLNLADGETTISSALSGAGTINKTSGGTLTLENTNNSQFAGNINVANDGILTFNQDSMLSSDADINLNNSTFNFDLTNAENISLTDTGFSTVNLTNSSTMNVDGTGLNQDIQIQVGNGFWTSDNSGNTLNFSNANYNLINEQGGSQSASDRLSFENANLSLQANQTWENEIVLDNTYLNLSNQSAGDTYTFTNLDASSNNNKLSVDVDFVYDEAAGTSPSADKIIVDEGSGTFELTRLFITDDNGQIANYDSPIQIIQNNNDAKVELAVEEGIEVLSWATNVYEYSIDSASSTGEGGLVDSIEVNPDGVSSTDTLRDLNHYGANRGFSFVTKDLSGGEVANEYHIYRDLDTTAEGTFSVIGQVIDGEKSVLSGELKELVIDENDPRYHDNTYDYLGPEQADGQRPVVDTATVDTPPALAEGEYTFAIGAMDSDDKANGSLFELTNATDLYITDVRIEDTLRTNSDSIKNGAAIYANDQDATVQLENVDFVGNIANALNDDGTGASNGGAIANELSRSFLINGSMLASNTASNDGGAIYNTSSGLTIENATFYANSAGNRGGAIYTSSDMKIINSNFGVDTAGVQNLNSANGANNDIYIDNNATLTFEVNNTQTASTIRSGIAGGGTFEKTSEGTLNLSGNNQDFTGKFKIADNGGKVLYNAASVDDSFVSGDVSIGKNSTLEMNISNGVLNQNINNVSGSGTLNKTGEGTLNLGGDNSAFEGKTQIQTGILNYIADNDTDRLFGVNSTTSIFKGAQFNINVNENIQNQTLYNIEGLGTVNKLENGTLYISGANSGFEGAMNVQEGIVQYNNVSGNSPQNTSYIQGTTTLYNGTEFIANVDGASNFTDTFKGDFKSDNAQSSANFTKTGGGTLSLTGDLKNLNADVSIQNGILEFVKNENNGYINGDTTVDSGTFIYDTNGKDAELSNNIKGAGNFTKEGEGTLTINGDYSGLTGNTTVQEGILKYIAGNGNYFGGTTKINSSGKLIINTNGSNNITASNISGEGKFNKTGNGTLTLSGANGSFNGKSYICKGTLAFSNADGSTYFAGATTIADGAILAYTTGTDATLSNVLGQGTLQKLGSEELEFNYVNANNQKFEGEAVVDNGTLTVNAANDANSNFDFDMTVNNGKLVYNAAQNQNYNIGTADSKVSFGEKANGATITFNGGNYNLADDIENYENNFVVINASTVTLAGENKTYKGNYTFEHSDLNLADSNNDNQNYSHYIFENLNADDTNLSLDLGFKNPADETMYDKITVNNGNASFNVISVNMIPSNGVNNSDGTASDSGENETLTFNVLGGEATFNSIDSLTSYATNKYTYDVTYKDGQNIVFTKTGNSDSNTLKRQNINEIDDIREFQFDNDINAGNPYQLYEDLTETNDGTFTVIGYDDGSVTAGNPITTVDGSNNHSMFEVGNDTELNVSDIHFTNANATDDDINGGTDKYSDSIHGSILALTGGSATLDNVKATNNESEGFGGAIYANNGELVLKDIYFENNVHKQGSGTEADNDIYVTGNADVSITGDSVVKSGLAGDGTINAYDNFDLTGNNKDFTGTLNVIGNTEFVQESADDSYISGTTVINRGAQLMLDNDYNDIEATFAGSGGELIKEGANDLILTGDNSSMTGNVIVNEGNIILNTDNATYFGGSTELASGTGIEIDGSKDALLSNVEGASDTTITKDGSGKLTLDGNNGYDGSLLMNNGTFGLGYNSNYTIANAVFNNGTSINLQNTAAVYENGSWTTNPDPAGIESVSFDNLTLNGDIGLYLDVDLKNGQADTISANNVSGDGLIILGSDGINAVTDALVENTSVKIASGAITDYIQLAEDDMEIMGPIQEYLVNYNDGMLNFMAMGGDHPSYNQLNPGIMSGAVAAQMGGYLTQLNSYDEAFRNMDMYMLMTKKQRDAMKYRNKYAYNGSSGIIYDASISRQENKSGWLRPFATFEQVDLDGGPDVSNVAYGSYFGIDSEFIDLGHGWDGVWSAYAGYNGSHQAYDGIGIYQNGGTLGVVGMAYKGNFFTGLTVNAGASAGRANVDAGYDDFTMLMSGVASKTGYNFELFDGKFIIQPSYMMSYSFVNTFDYTSASGVRVTSDPLHAIHIEPGIKFIGNLKNGWQPYMGISMIWNVMDKTKFMANEVYLPELSIKPFVKYGVGLRKSWGERFTGYLQTYITNGGRNGIGLQAGFNWALGKPVERQRQAFGIVPKVESVKFVKK